MAPPPSRPGASPPVAGAHQEERKTEEGGGKTLSAFTTSRLSSAELYSFHHFFPGHIVYSQVKAKYFTFHLLLTIVIIFVLV